MFCPNCGKEYFENQNFCRYCGTKLNNCDENSVQPEEQIIAENQPIQETVENNTEKTVYNIDLITGTHSESYEENSGMGETVDNENTQSSSAETDFDEISENEEYKKYKKELLQKRTQYLDKQVAEKRTEEFEKQQKKLSPKVVAGISGLVVLLVLFGNLLWSIDVETQITPSETGEAPELNLPTEDERAYTQEPSVQEEPPIVEAKDGIYSDKNEEPLEEKTEKTENSEKQETQTAKQVIKQEPVKEVKEVKKAPAEPPIPPMPKVQEPSLNFDPISN